MSRLSLLIGCSALIAGSSNFLGEAIPVRSASIQSHHSALEKGSAFVQVRAVTAENVTSACLATFNALRTSNLSPALPTLVVKTEFETEAADKAKALAGTTDQCEKGATYLNVDATESGFIVPVKHDTAVDCASIIQGIYTSGMKHLQNQKYDASKAKFKPGTAPFDTTAAVSLAYMMWKDNKEVGCAVTKNCAAGYNVLYCKFLTQLKQDELPFTTETYNALVKRDFAGSSASYATPGLTAVLVSFVLVVLAN